MTKKTIQRLTLATPEQQKDALKVINFPYKALPVHGEDLQPLYALVEKIALKYTKTYPPSYVYNDHSYFVKLQACDLILGTHGVEWIRLSERDRAYSVHNDVITYYCNIGETYTPTLMYRMDTLKQWDILSMGDLINILEKKGRKLR